MLDSYTSSMCIDSWGRSNFSRCLIEVNADGVLKESITMGIPLLDGLGFYKETTITVTHIVDKSNDGFQMAVYKKKNGKTGVKIGGQSVKPNVKYVSKVVVGVPKTGASNVESEEEVENVFCESVNLLSSAKTRASSIYKVSVG
ncbi:hypothetical protein Tco_1454960 [Tanacetum coccineum]